MTYDRTQIQNIVVTAAREELVPRFANVKRELKADRSVVTEADLIMQRRVEGELQKIYPGTLLLGEEMTKAEQSSIIASGRPAWCLDPIDGTSNFAAGIPYFSVSLALVRDGRVEFGFVYDPMREECFSACLGQGAELNGDPLRPAGTVSHLGQAMGLIDFKRLPTDLAVRLVREAPYASQRSFGSVALDWCWLAAERVHVYLHGRQQIWDYAAGNLVLHEVGGFSTTLDGAPVFVHELCSRSAVAAPNKALFEEWTAWLGVSVTG